MLILRSFDHRQFNGFKLWLFWNANIAFDFFLNQPVDGRWKRSLVVGLKRQMLVQARKENTVKYWCPVNQSNRPKLTCLKAYNTFTAPLKRRKRKETYNEAGFAHVQISIKLRKRKVGYNVNVQRHKWLYEEKCTRNLWEFIFCFCSSRQVSPT